MAVTARSIRPVDGNDDTHDDTYSSPHTPAAVEQPKEPRPDPIEIAKQRAEQVVGDVSDQAVMELGKAAEEINTLIEVLGAERRDVTTRIQRYAANAGKAIKATHIIADNLAQLRDELKIT